MSLPLHSQPGKARPSLSECRWCFRQQRLEDHRFPPVDPIKIPEVVARKAREIQVIGDLVSLAIMKGFILTNYQPELAAALVEQMNQERAGFADELLEEMLFVYHGFLYQKARGIS